MGFPNMSASCLLAGLQGFAPGVAAGASFRNPAAALQAWRSRRGVGLDICCQPGLQQLSRAERELCAQLRLLPAHYLCLKDHLMRDGVQNGFISRQDVRGKRGRREWLGEGGTD
jgi:hypothetical protein